MQNTSEPTKNKTDMETVIDRKDIHNKLYKEMLETESHHQHEIVMEKGGILRWKENPEVRFYLNAISLNDLCSLLETLGYGKNSEVYRKLYRDMGYSLFGYWEIFYWDMNNPEADKYRPTIRG